ncbi:MAG: ParM/StbA family protein [Anaerolineae bacterium]|nr:ParM/StbA family protein [Anaerolineae bacterium]
MARKISKTMEAGDTQSAQEAGTYDVYADIGHGYGKFLCGNRQAVFATVIASVQPDEADFASTVKRKRFVIELGDQYYAIDQDALENRRNLRRRLDQSGLGGELHRVVMVAGFTQVVPDNGNIRLITQIPISWYNQKDKLYNLADRHAGSYGGKPFWYVLRHKDITVYPESFGTIICHCFNAQGEPVYDFGKNKVIVVDCGTQTTNVGVFEGLRFIAPQSFTIQAGMSDVWEYIQASINRDYGRKPALDDIDRAIRDENGQFRLGANTIDLNESEYLPTAVQQVAHTIITEIQNNLEGGTLGNYILGSGGGWWHVQSYIQKYFGDQLLDSNDFPAARKVEPWMRNVTGLKRFELFKAARNGKA